MNSSIDDIADSKIFVDDLNQIRLVNPGMFYSFFIKINY